MPTNEVVSFNALLCILRIVLLREDPAAQVEDGQWAWQPNSFADRHQCQVPAADDTNHSKASSNL